MMSIMRIHWWIVVLILCFPFALKGENPRKIMSLSGIWQIAPDENNIGMKQQWFRDESQTTWQYITVPSSWETALGVNFDGIAWYRKSFRLPNLTPENHIYLRFYGVATETKIWINGHKCGGHLGAWTSFTCDITPFIEPARLNTIVMRVDEKVGHNTQGFLPIIAPHFGGIWQKVEIIITGACRIDDTSIIINAANLSTANSVADLRATVPVISDSSGAGWTMRFDLQYQGKSVTKPQERKISHRKANWSWRGAVNTWNIDNPAIYDLTLTLFDARHRAQDEVIVHFGFRRVDSDGPVISLNGKPVVVRGVLNWGYYPPQPAPSPTEKQFLRQIRYFRDCGFNLIKFCLWLPPPKYLDIMDEEGMLAWIEYPTWHPKIDQEHRRELLHEYREMSNHDGNHPSVILRSITCETGPSADLEVIRALYDLIKARCPHTLLLDDSSWIGWNRVHDFWDDHSYGNNRSWRDKLASLQDYRRQHGMMPLLLGEAIAADTWPDSRRICRELPSRNAWWQPRWLADQLRFEYELEKRYGEPGFSVVDDLHRCSLKYALDMRRWQIETYHSRLPHAGYVVSTMQDVTLCNMGLLDGFGQPKWSAAHWSWHGKNTVALETPADQRGFRLHPLTAAWQQIFSKYSAVPDIPSNISKPRRFSVRKPADSQSNSADAGWELWALPDAPIFTEKIILHGKETVKNFATMFPAALSQAADQPLPKDTAAVITCAFDNHILDYLEKGGRVLHFTSGRRGSFRTEDTWFLRGTVWAPPQPKAFYKICPREMLSYLQLFELGGNSVIRGEALWNQVDPLLCFIETHDLERVRSNLLLFQTRVGKGRLIVSCLRHQGGLEDNYAGFWLGHYLLRYLLDGQPPGHCLRTETIESLHESLTGEILPVKQSWRFRKDSRNEGTSRKWYRRNLDDSGWMSLQTASAAEAKAWQGYDGWGWYRCFVKIPAQWQGKRIKLVFDSVDDMYELYINGKKAGGYGKMDRTQSSFMKRTWIEVTNFITPGKENQVTVRVYDWTGAAGINGPVWFTTGPAEPALDLLRR